MRWCACLVFFICLGIGSGFAQTEPKQPVSFKWSIATGMNFIHTMPKGFAEQKFSQGFLLSVGYRTWQKGLLYYRSEIMFSGQGYEFVTPTSSGSVGLGYLYFPQIFGISVSRTIDLQLGLQAGVPLMVNADSIAIWDQLAVNYGKARDWVNPFVVGLAAGIELHPLKHISIGARLNHPFTSLAKDNRTVAQPSFLPPKNQKLKACWIQVGVGYQF